MDRGGRLGRAVVSALVLGMLGLGTNQAAALSDDWSDEWRAAYKVGDRVELHIDRDLWQQCVVTENQLPSVMKARCEEIVEPAPGNYRRAGGIYILGQRDTRPAGRASEAPAPAAGTTPAASPGRTGTSLAASGHVAGPGSFRVGERVEIEASHHWVPCVVAENQAGTLMRVHCEAYPALSRGAGLYMVDRDNPAQVRKATGKIGKVPEAPPVVRQTAAPAGLRVGEYACYGSGGRSMIGLAFKVLAGDRYTDLEGGNAGAFSVSGTTVSFQGGHLGGQTGRNLRGHTFTIGAKADCEPFVGS